MKTTKSTKKWSAMLLAAVMLIFLASCGSKETENTPNMTDMTDEERIISAAQAGTVGNWGLGNEYEIQALLTKYGQSTD